MSNDYFNHLANVVPQGSLARSAQINALANEIQSGFDKLPTEAEIKRGNVNYLTDTGSANACEVAMAYPITDYVDGLQITFKVASTNTTAMTLAVDGLAAKQVVKVDGRSMQPNDVAAGSILTVVYDGTKFQATTATVGEVNDAIAAQTAAETAQGLAETAQGLAEDARDESAAQAVISTDQAELSHQYALLSQLGANALPSLIGNSGKKLVVNQEEDFVEWGFSGITYEARSSNTMLATEDSETVFNLTGTFTQTFDTSANLKMGWYVIASNVGTGIITLDPAETIDGESTCVMLPNERRLIHCDGSVLRSMVLNAFHYRISSSTSFAETTGYSRIGYKMASGSGGGGSGARRSDTVIYGGCGGGGGGLVFGEISNLTPGGTVTVLIGDGGTGAPATTVDDHSGGDGADGGSTSISGTGFDISIEGGKGGIGGNTSSPTGNLGGGVGTYVAATGSSGFRQGGYAAPGEFGGGGGGKYSVPGVYGPSGGSVWGGGAGGCGAGYNTTATSASTAGSSTYGNSGGAGGAVTVAGSDGLAVAWKPSGGGGGGGASRNGTNSGKGGDGGPGWAEIWGII